MNRLLTVTTAAFVIVALSAPAALSRAPRDRLVLSAQAAEKPVSSPQGPDKSPGVVISASGSAVISTQGMPPGGEIWAEWFSLPPGQAVAEAAGTAKWAHFEMALDGSATVSGGPTPMCSSVNAGGRLAASSDPVTDAGDIEVCNYSVLPAFRTENRGTQPYVFAGLSVGGPWQEGMEDAADLYRKVNGLAKAMHVTPSQFANVEKEILGAGVMKVAIRNVTILPGARIVTTDHYPTLRMVENGQLTVGPAPASANAPAPKVLAAFDTMEWAPASADKQVVLSNSGEQPVQFVEWVLAPVQGATP